MQKSACKEALTAALCALLFWSIIFGAAMLAQAIRAL